MKLFSRFLSDESGATAIEYGLIAALISIAAIVVMGEVGQELQSTFSDVRDGLNQGQSTSR